MKKFAFSFMLFCMSTFVYAQDCDIPLRPLVAQSSDGSYYPQVVNYLTNRLRVLTSKAGSIGGMENSQFALAFGYDVIDKQIVSSFYAILIVIIIKVHYLLFSVLYEVSNLNVRYIYFLKCIDECFRLVVSDALYFVRVCSIDLLSLQINNMH